MPYYFCPYCGNYQQSETINKKSGKKTGGKKCECPPLIGLIWRADNERASRWRTANYVWYPHGRSFQYYGDRSPGRWINVITDEVLKRPEWIKWAKVPIIIDRTQGRNFKAVLEIKGKNTLVWCLGANRPGLYHAMIASPPADIFAEFKATHPKATLEPSSTVVIVPHAYRKQYARTPKVSGLTTTVASPQDRTVDGRFMPRWTADHFTIEKWEYRAVPAQNTGDKPILQYMEPADAQQRIGKDSGSNAWCHTPIHECEWKVDPRPGYEAIRKHLDDYGFKHLDIDWVQRRFLFYTSDGQRSRQVGQIEYEHPQFGSNKKVLLWAGECWALQLSAKDAEGRRRGLIPGILFVSDDMVFIATHQCLRIGQTMAEYQKGINLYAPHAAPMQLHEFVTGPLTDYWERQGNIKLIRPKMKLMKAKQAASAHELQKELLDKVAAKYDGMAKFGEYEVVYAKCPQCGKVINIEHWDKKTHELYCENCDDYWHLPPEPQYFANFATKNDWLNNLEANKKKAEALAKIAKGAKK